jgi:hypothetical protein
MQDDRTERTVTTKCVHNERQSLGLYLGLCVSSVITSTKSSLPHAQGDADQLSHSYRRIWRHAVEHLVEAVGYMPEGGVKGKTMM